MKLKKTKDLEHKCVCKSKTEILIYIERFHETEQSSLCHQQLFLKQKRFHVSKSNHPLRTVGSELAEIFLALSKRPLPLALSWMCHKCNYVVLLCTLLHNSSKAHGHTYKEHKERYQHWYKKPQSQTLSPSLIPSQVMQWSGYLSSTGRIWNSSQLTESCQGTPQSHTQKPLTEWTLHITSILVQHSDASHLTLSREAVKD